MLFYYSCLFFSICLFSKEREKEGVELDGWGGRIWEVAGEGNHYQNILYEKNYLQVKCTENYFAFILDCVYVGRKREGRGGGQKTT